MVKLRIGVWVKRRWGVIKWEVGNYNVQIGEGESKKK